jgi:hypothetical protein
VKWQLLVLAVSLTGSATAQEAAVTPAAECVAPAPPDTWSPGQALDKVVPPKCLDLEKGTTTCSKKVFDGYNAQIRAYNDALKARIEAFNTYTKSLNSYVLAASDYSACQNARASALMPFDK